MAHQLTLTEDEIFSIQSSLMAQIDDITTVTTDVTAPLLPDARRDLKKILFASKSALKKIQGISGVILPAAPFEPGDEQQFFTKES